MFIQYLTKAIAVTSLSILAAGAAIAEAHAASTQAPSVAVKYSDLNLGTAAGVRVLYRRLQAGSRQVCRGYEGRELAKVARWQACYEQALSTAVSKVRLETLSALHQKANSRGKLS